MYLCLIKLTRTSTQRIQHCSSGMMHRASKSKQLGQSYVLVKMFPISAANSSPPLPSNTGVALAELKKKEKSSFESFCCFYIKTESKTLLHGSQPRQGFTICFSKTYQSTKNSSLPLLGLSGEGVPSSAFTPARMSVFALKKYVKLQIHYIILLSQKFRIIPMITYQNLRIL